jgi:hypothetical protein
MSAVVAAGGGGKVLVGAESMPIPVVGQLFAQTYYQALSESPAAVLPFYGDDSAITRAADAADEGAVDATGLAEIQQKLAQLPATRRRVRVESIDCQASGDGLLLVVTGFMAAAEGDEARTFAQTFLLARHQGQGVFYVRNEVLRFLAPPHAAHPAEAGAAIGHGVSFADANAAAAAPAQPQPQAQHQAQHQQQQPQHQQPQQQPPQQQQPQVSPQQPQQPQPPRSPRSPRPAQPAQPQLPPAPQPQPQPAPAPAPQSQPAPAQPSLVPAQSQPQQPPKPQPDAKPASPRPAGVAAAPVAPAAAAPAAAVAAAPAAATAAAAGAPRSPRGEAANGRGGSRPTKGPMKKTLSSDGAKAATGAEAAPRNWAERLFGIGATNAAAHAAAKESGAASQPAAAAAAAAATATGAAASGVAGAAGAGAAGAAPAAASQPSAEHKGDKAAPRANGVADRRGGGGGGGAAAAAAAAAAAGVVVVDRRSESAKERARQEGLGDIVPNAIVVKHMPSGTSEDDVRVAFSVYGAVAGVRFHPKIATLCTVTFAEVASAAKAMAVAQHTMSGLPVMVEYLLERLPRGPGGERGGRVPRGRGGARGEAMAGRGRRRRVMDDKDDDL